MVIGPSYKLEPAGAFKNGFIKLYEQRTETEFDGFAPSEIIITLAVMDARDREIGEYFLFF